MKTKIHLWFTLLLLVVGGQSSGLAQISVVSPLTVNIVGNGNVLPAGLFATNLIHNHTYTLTAVPGSGFLFGNWSNSVTAGVTETARLTFVMKPGLVLTATFITNGFPAAAGRYYGLFSETNGVSLASAGYITMNVDRRQSFSGILFLAGNPISFTGNFNRYGQGTANRLSGRGAAALDLVLQLGFDDTLSGTLSNRVDHWVAEIDADRLVSNFGRGPASDFSGQYTLLVGASRRLLLPTGLNVAVPVVPTPPPGFGPVTIKITPAGMVQAGGYLTDNQRLLPMAAAVSKAGEWPFYARVYNAGGGTYGGVVMGWLHFDSLANNALASPAESEISPALLPTISGNLTWIKSSASPTSGYYDTGFTNDVPVAGSLYLPPAPGQRVIQIGLGTLTLAEGDLPAPLSYDLAVLDNNAIVMATTDLKPKFYFDSALGLLNCSFRNPARKGIMAQVRSAYLPSQNFIGGYFLGASQSSSFLIDAAPMPPAP